MDYKVFTLYLIVVAALINQSTVIKYFKSILILCISYTIIVVALSHLQKFGFDQFFLLGDSVGLSTYSGYPFKIPIYLLSIAIFLINLYIIRKVLEIRNELFILVINNDFPKYISVILLTVISIILIPTFTPNTDFTDGIPKLSWDGQNLKYWMLLLSEGKLPYRDFWWPYFGSFIFYYNDSLSYLLKYIYSITGILIVYYGVLKLFNLKISSICLILFLLCYINGYFFNITRFYQVVVIIFIFYLINKNINFQRILLLLYLSIIIFIDYSIFIVSLSSIIFPLLITLIYYFFNSKRISTYNFRKITSFLYDTLIFSAASISLVIISLLMYLGSDLFIKYLKIFLDIGKILEFTTQPVPINYLQKSINDDYIIGILGFIIAPIFFANQLVNYSIDKKIIFIALLNSILFLSIKHFLRGPLGIEITASGIFLLILLLSTYISRFNNKIIITLFSLLLIINAPYFTRNFDYKLVSLNNYLESKFLIRNINKPVISEYYKKRLTQIPNFLEGKFFIFGDDPLLYLLTNNPRPPHSAMYNSSTKLSQIDTIRYINDNNIITIAVSKDNFDFDGFSYLIRNKYITNYILNNYKLDHESENFYIFKEGIGSVDTNVGAFGDKIFLGRIPNHSSKTKPALLFTPTVSEKNYEIDALINNVNIKIYFRTSKYLSSKSIKIPLDILWFCYEVNQCKLDVFSSNFGDISIIN
jgi:hypothetical protein